MARYRLSLDAEADVARILATSRREWGAQGRRRYAALIALAMRTVAAEPKGPTTRDRSQLRPGIRSFHLQHTSGSDAVERVRRPVHVLYYRLVVPGVVEIIRVLHERMEPARNLCGLPEDE